MGVYMKPLLFLILFVLSFPVFSGNGSGKVNIEYTGIWEAKALLFFYTDIHISPSNWNTYNRRWLVDLSTEEGKVQHDFIANTQEAGNSIKMVGENGGNLWGNSETVHWVEF